MDSSVNIGRRLHHISELSGIRMMNFLMGVVQQQRTTAAILMRRGQKESGALQWNNGRNGNRVTYHSVYVSLFLLLERVHLYSSFC